ncbi:MAG: Gfo/Idh/MocA family oxidoreductase [Candidatus Pacebacteria bacterium]|nr:Gfo/Idh/MocA family oxidoreductase [Candidatus Paceibacterota bacterium]
MTKKYTAAVIGCGRIGMKMELDPKRSHPATHVGAWLNNPRTELVALADPNPASKEVAAQVAPGVPMYSSAEELFAAVKPDIVSIATILEGHYPVVMAAAKAGVKAIVCEKPIAESVEQGLEMIDACKKSGSLLIINHFRRFDPVLNQWAQKVRGGLIGDIQQITGTYSIGLYHMGTHLIDFIRMFAGDIDWVMGKQNTRAHTAIPGDTCVDAIMGMRSGARAAIQSLNVKDYSNFEVRFLGTKGSVCVRDMGRGIEYIPVQESKQYGGFCELHPDKLEYHENPYFAKMTSMTDYVVACLDGTVENGSKGEDGLAVLRVLMALKMSGEADGSTVVV